MIVSCATFPSPETTVTGTRDVREVRLDHLVNRDVTDAGGRVFGRLKEVRAAIVTSERGNEYRVTDYVVVPGGTVAHAFRKLLRRGKDERYVVPWDLMDLSDPARPHVRAVREELRVEE